MAIDDNTTYGLTGAQVKDLASRVNNLKTNAGAPTTATVGTVGQLLADTTNGKLYICTAIVPGTDPDPDTYTWTEVGTGSGSGITTLTSADYNWPATGTKTGLAHWLLEPGIYKIDNSQGSSDFTIYLDSTTTGKVSAGTESVMVVSSYIAYNNKEHSVIEAVMTSGGYPGVWSADTRKDDPSLESNIGRVLKSSYVVDNLTSTSTVLPLSAKQGKVLNEKIEGRVKTNAGAPTTSTVGTVGMLLEDTTNGKVYICTDATNPYVWEEVGGGGGVTVLTSADYNEPAGAPTRINLHNLPNGYYIVRAGTQIVYNSTTTPYTLISDKVFIISESAAGSAKMVLTFDGANGFQYNIDSDGRFTPYVINSLTSNLSNFPLAAAQGKNLNEKIDERILASSAAPTTSTEGSVGQLFEDTTNGKLYICTDATDPYVWEEVGTGGGSNTMVLYTNQDLPDTASSSYHLYSDINLTTTVDTRDIYDCYKSGGNVVLFIPTSSENPGTIYGGYITDLHQVYFDTSDDVYVALFVVKESFANPKLYEYSGSTGDWGGKTAFVDAVSPSTLNSMIATNAGAPTSSTAGTKGQLLEDTTNGKLYICTAASGGTYTWEEIDYSGLTTLSYGNSTWNDFITAYNAGKIVYCKASSNANPATGTQGRMAFMAYINNPDAPTEVEFQYVRSVSSKTAAQPCDQVFVYKLTSASGGTWTVATRDMTYKVAAGTNVTTSYSNGTVTINADAPVITMQSTDPGEGVPLAANNFIAVYSV